MTYEQLTQEQRAVVDEHLDEQDLMRVLGEVQAMIDSGKSTDEIAERFNAVSYDDQDIPWMDVNTDRYMFIIIKAARPHINRFVDVWDDRTGNLLFGYNYIDKTFIFR